MKARTNGEIASDLVPDMQVRMEKTAQNPKAVQVQGLVDDLVGLLGKALEKVNEVDRALILVDEQPGPGGESMSEVVIMLEGSLRETLKIANGLQAGL